MAIKKRRTTATRRRADLDALWAEHERCRPFLRASVVVSRKRCMHEDCRLCRSGQKHPFSRMTIRKGGKTKTRYLPKDLIETAREWVANFKRAKEIRERMSELWLEDLLDEDEHAGRDQ